MENPPGNQIKDLDGEPEAESSTVDMAGPIQRMCTNDIQYNA